MRATVTLLAIYLMISTPVLAASDKIFMVKSTNQSPEAVVKAIKDYAQEMKWQYLGDNKVKKGAVTLVKICIPEVGWLVWPLGLRFSAMLPCGNIGVYQTTEGTEVSVLHPRYLSLLYPDPKLDRASEVAAPLLKKMLDSVTQD